MYINWNEHYYYEGKSHEWVQGEATLTHVQTLISIEEKNGLGFV